MSREGRALVIGYGNPLRADDGFGWQVAQQLAASLPADVARVLAVHQLTPELAEEVGRASLVVFVDAHAGGRAGQVVIRSLIADTEQLSTFSHHVGAPVVLGLAGTLFEACPPAVMVSVGGDDFGYGVGLSPAVAATLSDVLERVLAILRSGRLDATSFDAERTQSCTR